MFEITPHHHACKLKTIAALAKIIHFTFIFAVDGRVLLLWLVDIIVHKMMSANLVEAFGVASNAMQLQLKTKKGKFFDVDEDHQLCCLFLHVS